MSEIERLDSRFVEVVGKVVGFGSRVELMLVAIDSIVRVEWEDFTEQTVIRCGEHGTIETAATYRDVVSAVTGTPESEAQ